MNNTEKLHDDIAKVTENGLFNGTICITVNGETIVSGAYGIADEENNIPFTPHTKCYIASVTKQMTAACAMMLSEKGLLNVDDKLSRYVPEYRFADKITLRQMLNMRSGIPDELSVLGDRVKSKKDELGLSEKDFEILLSKSMAPEKCTCADFLEVVNSRPLDFEPGTAYAYSDTNYMLMGEIIGRLTNSSIGEFMTENIFKPLGMKDSQFGADNSEAVSYSNMYGEKVCLGKAHFITGEGAVCTTATDLCIWLNAVMNGKLLKKESWDECLRYVEGYAFGWHENGPWHTHGGGDLGYLSADAFNLSTHTAAALVSNQAPRADIWGTMLRIANELDK